MELLQIQYFCEVAKTESVTKAAESLHIAQPSLSKTISRLEEQLGVSLFDRVGKRIRLNEFGKSFLVHAQNCLCELENGVKELNDLAKQKETSVSIGSTTARRLPDLMKAYLLQNPDIKLRLLQAAQHTELLHQLEEGEIDISISSLPFQEEGICSKKLISERICLIVPLSHRLAGRKEASIGELNEENFIFYTAESGLGDIVKQFLRDANFHANISCECTTPEVICALVESGLGLAFLPEYLSAMEYTKDVVWIPVGTPKMQRTIWASWNENRYLTKTARDFQSFLFQYFSNT